MSVIPRRLPPTPGERVKSAIVQLTAPSKQGGTRMARPVNTSGAKKVQNSVYGNYVPQGDIGDGTLGSTAAGLNSAGLGVNAVSVGYSWAYANSSTAVGDHTKAFNVGDTAVGYGAQASGDGVYTAAAFGEGSAAAKGATAINSGSVRGDYGVALGYFANVDIGANGSVAIGCDSTASGAEVHTSDTIALGTDLHVLQLSNPVVTSHGASLGYLKIKVNQSNISGVPDDIVDAVVQVYLP